MKRQSRGGKKEQEFPQKRTRWRNDRLRRSHTSVEEIRSVKCGSIGAEQTMAINTGLEAAVSFASDDKNYRTMNVLRRNSSQIVAMKLGPKQLNKI